MAYVSKIIPADAANLAAGRLTRDVGAARAGVALPLILETAVNLAPPDRPSDRPRTGIAAVCLTTGAMIETPHGPRLIETLEVGDLVLTRGNGPQPLRHVLHRRLAPLTVKDRPHLAPITIRAGSIGVGLPRRDLNVSPEHRVLISDPRLETTLGPMPCQMAAAQLVDVVPGIVAKRVIRTVTYVHLALEKDEIIFAEGVPTECSDLAGRGVLPLSDPSAAEIREVFAGFFGHDGSVVLPEPGGSSNEKGAPSSRMSKDWNATASLGPKPIRALTGRAGWLGFIFA
jgi:hypothetical protein